MNETFDKLTHVNAKPRKIAIVTDAWFPQINGVVTTLSHVHDELVTRGHTMVVISPQLFHTVPCPRYPEIRLSWLPGRMVRRMIRNDRFDAIHIATEGPLGMAARWYCGRHSIPFTTSYHTQFPMYLKRYIGLPSAISYRLIRWFHNRAVNTLVPSQSIKDELNEHRLTGLHVWTRGVETDIFKPHGKDLFPEPRPIFLYAGRVAYEKNLEAFLSADLPGTKYVVGDGPALRSLKRKYRDAVFVGFKHGVDLARHYAAADVFVFPSKTDTFGIVMIEAMACGVPVAAYPVPGPIDIVIPRVTGILDDDIRTAALAALDLDAEVCRKHALGYSWSKCADLFFDCLAPISPTHLRQQNVRRESVS